MKRKLVYLSIPIAIIIAIGFISLSGEGEDTDTEDYDGRQILLQNKSDVISNQPAIVESEPQIYSVSVLSKNYLGFGDIAIQHDDSYESYEEDEATYKMEEEKREYIIADCMEINGYKYMPSPSIDVEVESEEEVNLLVNEILHNDPNKIYFDGLPFDQKKLYNITLYGNDGTEMQGAYNEDLYNESCSGIADQKVPGVYHVRGKLTTQIQEMDENIRNDEKLINVENEWITCMENSGYLYSEKRQINGHVDDLFSHMQYTEMGINSVLDVTPQLETIYLEFSNSDKSDSAYFEFESKIEKYLESASIVEQECETEVDYVRILKKVRNEHEMEFIKEHQEILNGVLRN